MSVSGVAVSAGTVSVAVAACPDGDVNGQDVLVVNNGGSAVYLGGSDVTTAIGVPLAASAAASFSLEPSETVYGITASGTVDVRVLTVTGSR